jgi:phosphoglycerate dehydrogenase-like enzyme
MTKIVVTHDLGLSEDDKNRLKSLGDVTIYDSRPKSPEEWLERCNGADIICSGIPGLREKYQELNNVFITLPLVNVAYLNIETLDKNNVKVSNSPGCNKDAVSEWIIGMIINLLRKLPFYINNNDLPKDKAPEQAIGLAGKTVLILGKGNIGNRVGEICESLKMNVAFFERSDDLNNKIKGKSVIVNCLSTNKTSIGLLDKKFFNSLDKNAYFISVSSNEIYDSEAMFKALDNGILNGVAIDDGTMNVGNTSDFYYQKLLKHPKILATPHIAYNSDISNKEGNRIMIDNIEAFLANKPINLIN